LPPQDAVIASAMLGESLDRLGDTEEAFAAYATANRRFLEASVGTEPPPLATMAVEQVAAALAALEPASAHRAR
jgi:hypothetical protein